nr:hypothetical protein [Limnohabitans sp. 2KL-27]
MQQGPITACPVSLCAGKNPPLELEIFNRNSQLKRGSLHENLTGKQACHADRLTALIDRLTACCLALIRALKCIAPLEFKLIRVHTQRITSNLLERYLNPLAQFHLARMQGDDLRPVQRQPKMQTGIFDNAWRHRNL